MSLNVDIRGREVMYKCFGCLKIFNPITSKPTVVTAITQMVPQQDGKMAMQINPVHVCPKCYSRGKSRGTFADVYEIDPNAGKQPQPQAMIDKSTELPTQDGRPRGKGGKLSLK